MQKINEFEKATKRAKACTTPEEAKELYRIVMYGSVAEEVYRARWVELADAEAPGRAQACTTSEEAMALYDHAPNRSVAKEVYRARREELADAEAKSKK